VASPFELRNQFGIRLAIFQPSRLGIVVAPTSNPGRTVPIRGVGALALDHSAALAANGPMFDNCSGQNLPPGNASYARSHCSILQYRAFDRSRDINAPGVPAKSLDGMTISVVGGRALATAANLVPAGASVAVQLYPALLSNGHVLATADRDTERVYRAGLFIMADGRLGLAMGPGLSMLSFANAAKLNGAVTGGYLDGGGSARWALRDGTWYGASEDRPVASWIVIRDNSISAETLLGLALGMGAVGAGLWVISTFRTGHRRKR
jgi:hypothetical protein